MLEDIRSFTNIPTPLALGGLIVGGLIIIFLAVLKLKIFPRLNRELGEKTISRMMLYLFILALIGMILGFIGYILPLILGNSGNQSNSNVVKVSTEFTRDITLRDAIKRLAKDDGRIVSIAANCSDSFMNTMLNKGKLQAPSMTMLISQLQKNLTQPNPNESYEVKLSEEGVYEVICKKN